MAKQIKNIFIHDEVFYDLYYSFESHVEKVVDWAERNRFSADKNILNALDAFNERKASRYGKLLNERNIQHLEQTNESGENIENGSGAVDSEITEINSKIESNLTALQIVDDKEAFKTLLEDVSERKAIKIGYNTSPNAFSKIIWKINNN